MGAVTTLDAKLHERLKLTRMRMGWGVSADDCFLVLRGLATLQMRLAAHGQAALSLAQWLKNRVEVARVLHPAFADCPGHEVWQRDFSGATGLFSVVFDAAYSAQQVDAFVEALKLFKIGYSWGGAHSLVMPYETSAMRRAGSWPPAHWQSHGVPQKIGILVRFYVGLEAVEDLIADIAQALQKLEKI